MHTDTLEAPAADGADLLGLDLKVARTGGTDRCQPAQGSEVLPEHAVAAGHRDRVAGGATVLVPSHQFGEIAQLCDQVSVLTSGRAAYQGDLAGLASKDDLEAGFFRFLKETGAASR